MPLSRSEEIELADHNHHDDHVPAPGPPRLEGYPSFAEFITRYDAAIFRKFGHLSGRNLLYLQSELLQLEAELQELDWEDAQSVGDEDAQKAARSWKYYSDGKNARAKKHRNLQRSIRKKIKEYHEALLLENRVLALNAPSDSEISNIRRWFKGSSAVPVLWDRDKNLFDNARDLVVLAPADTDRLNHFLQKYFGWLFKENPGRDDVEHERSKDVFFTPPRRIQRAGAVISVLFSAVLLIGAMVSLLLLQDQAINLRVGLVVLFTCLFAFVVGLLTNARRAEIFGSTAAYAAVLVVFVSNTGGTNGDGMPS